LSVVSSERPPVDFFPSGRNPKPSSRKEHLLRVAEQLFGEKGFDGASIRDIAAAAGVKIGSIYNFFSDKHALHSAALERVHSRLRQYVETAELADDPAENLRRVLGAVARFCDEHPMAHRMMVHEMMHFSEGVDRAVQVMHKTRSLVMDIINDGKRKGVFRDVDERAFSFGLINAVVGFFIARTLFGKLLTDEAGAADEEALDGLPFPLFETVMAGLRAGAPENAGAPSRR
jgi:AcrR family transcriptional regulator